MGGTKCGGGSRQKKHQCRDKKFRRCKRRYTVASGKVHRDVDQIQDTIIKMKEGTYKPEKPDIDLAGLGQYPCIICARYFIDKHTLLEHKRSKKHKKMRKKVAEEQYTQQEADRCGGLGREETVYDKKKKLLKAKESKEREGTKTTSGGLIMRRRSNIRFLSMDQT